MAGRRCARGRVSVVEVLFVLAMLAAGALVAWRPWQGGGEDEGTLGLRYGRRADQLLDVYLADGDTAGPHPLVVFVHGGGFSSGSRALGADRSLMRAVTGAGMVFASVDHGLWPPSRFPEPARDVARAVQYLRANAERFDLDPGRVALVGRSSGALLAGVVAWGPELRVPRSSDPVERESSRPQAWVNVSGPLDLLAMDGHVEVACFEGLRLMDVAHQRKVDASPLRLLHTWRTPPPPCFSIYRGEPGAEPLTDPHDARFGELLMAELAQAPGGRKAGHVLRSSSRATGEGTAGLAPELQAEVVAWIRDHARPPAASR